MSQNSDTPILCRLSDIPDGGSAGFAVTWPSGERRGVLAVRRGPLIFAYINSCPHVGAPLDLEAGRFLNLERTHIICSTHGAIFRIEDGHCVRGPCVGKSLAPVAVDVRDGLVLVVESAPKIADAWTALYSEGPPRTA